MLLILRFMLKKAVFLQRRLQRCRRFVNPGRWFARAVCDGTPRWSSIGINFSSGADWGQKCGINHRGQQPSASLLARPRSQCDKQRGRRSVIKHGWKDNRDSTNETGGAALWPSAGQGHLPLPPSPPPPFSGPSALPPWGQIKQELQHMTPFPVGRNLIFTWKSKTTRTRTSQQNIHRGVSPSFNDTSGFKWSIYQRMLWWCGPFDMEG